MDANSNWMPTASVENLVARAKMLWRLRTFFHERGILEVQVPCLSRDTVVDRHIDPVVVPGSSLGVHELRGDSFYLQTSPEFGMKRLLAAGMPDIYQISSVFRAEERGQYHNPEFTMIEWYRLGDGLHEAISLLAELVDVALNDRATFRETTVDTYQHVFQANVSLDPLTASVEELAEAAVANQLGVDQGWSNDRDDWLNLLFSEVVQPRLGKDCPVIVSHYPASQSALAKIADEDPRTAERFELFIRGVELANGYHELIDARELQSRNELVAKQRLQDRKAPLPLHSWLIDAMDAGLPSCSGCALGFDRLLMIALAADKIDDVIPFPIERA